MLWPRSATQAESSARELGNAVVLTSVLDIGQFFSSVSLHKLILVHSFGLCSYIRVL